MSAGVLQTAVSCSPDEIHGFDRLPVPHLLGRSRQGVLGVAECDLARFTDQRRVLKIATGHLLLIIVHSK